MASNDRSLDHVLINYLRFLMTLGIICDPNGEFMGFDNMGGCAELESGMCSVQRWDGVEKVKIQWRKINHLILTNVIFLRLRN